MDKAKAIRIQNAMDKFAKELAAAEGLRITKNSALYSDIDLKLTLVVEETSVESEQANFNTNAQLFGLTQDTFNKEFTYNGKTYRIVGIDRKSRKYPVKVLDVASGDIRLFTVDSIHKMIPESDYYKAVIARMDKVNLPGDKK